MEHLLEWEEFNINESFKDDKKAFDKFIKEYLFKKVSKELAYEYSLNEDNIYYYIKNKYGVWFLGVPEDEGISLTYHIPDCEIIGVWVDQSGIQTALKNIKKIEDSVKGLNIKEDYNELEEKLQDIFNKYKGLAA